MFDQYYLSTQTSITDFVSMLAPEPILVQMQHTLVIPANLTLSHGRDSTVVRAFGRASFPSIALAEEVLADQVLDNAAITRVTRGPSGTAASENNIF